MQWNPCMRIITGLHADVREEPWANAVFVHDPWWITLHVCGVWVSG
jgi:hypothetical protein